MKITINTEVLKRYDLSLGEFLVLLMSHYNEVYTSCYDSLVTKGLAGKNLFKEFTPVLSDNVKNLVAGILMESDDKAVNSNLNFKETAIRLRNFYPNGYKPGTTYQWKGTTDEIAQKLRTLVVKYNFTFTQEEAVAAVKEYVNSFKDFKYMQLLKYFILRTTDDGQGHKEIDSMFMSIIENNRK